MRILRIYISIIINSFIYVTLIKTVSIKKIIHFIDTRKAYRNKAVYSYDDYMQVLYRIINWDYFIIRNNCLKRTMLYYYYLKRLGFTDIIFNIGVTVKDGKPEGHSWIIKDNELLMDEADKIKEFEIIYSTKEGEE